MFEKYGSLCFKPFLWSQTNGYFTNSFEIANKFGN
jgi:hypothetical protein